MAFVPWRRIQDVELEYSFKTSVIYIYIHFSRKGYIHIVRPKVITRLSFTFAQGQNEPLWPKTHTICKRLKSSFFFFYVHIDDEHP